MKIINKCRYHLIGDNLCIIRSVWMMRLMTQMFYSFMFCWNFNWKVCTKITKSVKFHYNSFLNCIQTEKYTQNLQTRHSWFTESFPKVSFDPSLHLSHPLEKLLAVYYADFRRGWKKLLKSYLTSLLTSCPARFPAFPPLYCSIFPWIQEVINHGGQILDLFWFLYF